MFKTIHDDVQSVLDRDPAARTVLEVLRDKDRVRVEGVNQRKRHTRPSQADPDGGIITFEARPTSIRPGESALLLWHVENPAAPAIAAGWPGRRPASRQAHRVPRRSAAGSFAVPMSMPR